MTFVAFIYIISRCIYRSFVKEDKRVCSPCFTVIWLAINKAAFTRNNDFVGIHFNLHY